MFGEDMSGGRFQLKHGTGKQPLNLHAVAAAVLALGKTQFFYLNLPGLVVSP